MESNGKSLVQVPRQPQVQHLQANNRLQRTCACGQHTVAGGECDQCRKSREPGVGHAAVVPLPFSYPSTPTDNAEPVTSRSTSSGESRFAYNFSQVPTHTVSSSSVSTHAPFANNDFLGARSPVSASPIQGIQTKLTINEPGDAYEQEADQVAEQVMRMAAPEGPPSDDEDEAKNSLMRKQTSGLGARAATGTASVPPIVHEVLNSGRGRPLDATTRAFMEPRFGYDFSNVRVHTDARAAESARSVSALAYTVGRDVVFGEGQYEPETGEGRRLLAHELTHVVQQSVKRASGAVAREPANIGVLQRKDDPKAQNCDKTKAKDTCHTGCAMRWGRNTTCSKWGFFQGGTNKRGKDCCNSWPWSLEDHARSQLGLNGAASCTVKHEREIATITYQGNKVEVLCSDTMSLGKFGTKRISQKACTDEQVQEDGCHVIEMSPMAMQDLSGQTNNFLPVEVCYSGSQEDLCLHDGPGKDKFPESHHCLTRGCPVQEGTPKLKETGWPR